MLGNSSSATMPAASTPSGLKSTEICTGWGSRTAAVRYQRHRHRALGYEEGKALGVRVYELLGGAYRKQILLYANYWFIEGEHSAKDYARQAEKLSHRDSRPSKFDPFAHVHYWYGENLSDNNALTEPQKKLAIDLVAAVAEAAGHEVALAIETHAFLRPDRHQMAHRIYALNINWHVV